MWTCNWLDLETLRISINYAPKPPVRDTMTVHSIQNNRVCVQCVARGTKFDKCTRHFPSRVERWKSVTVWFCFWWVCCVCETSVFVYVGCLVYLITGPATHGPNRELQSPLINQVAGHAIHDKSRQICFKSNRIEATASGSWSTAHCFKLNRRYRRSWSTVLVWWWWWWWRLSWYAQKN
jgi:hypothetical protein